MNLAYLGCSFRHFAVKDLEKLYISKQDLSDFYRAIHTTLNLNGLCILMTCNRVEFYFETTTPESTSSELIKHIAAFKNLPIETVKNMLNYKEKQNALEHLFKVSCGIKSMVFGENEILGQVKTAYVNFTTNQQNSPLLNKVFQSAIATGKRTRSETQISQGAYSISSIAIEAIRERCLDYFAQDILIIGAGIIAERLIKKFDALGHPSISICNRSQNKADTLAKTYNLQCITLNTIKEKLHKYRIIFTATSAKEFLLNDVDLNQNTPHTYLIDLGVPRNINPNIDKLTNTTRLTITNLQSVADKNIHRRKKELEACENIIDEEIKKVQSWLDYKRKNKVNHEQNT